YIGSSPAFPRIRVPPFRRPGLSPPCRRRPKRPGFSAGPFCASVPAACCASLLLRRAALEQEKAPCAHAHGAFSCLVQRGKRGECSVLSHFAILGVAVLGVLDGLLVQALGPVREVDLQGGIAVLALQIVHHLAAVGRGRIQLEGVLPLRDPAGIIPVQMPVAALHRLLHLLLRAAHARLDTVLQAGAVSDDDGRAGIGLCLPDGLQGLGLVVAHGHLGHVDVAVAHGDGAQVLFLDLLAAGGELGHRRSGRRLGGLSAGVGVHLRIHHQHVDVPVLGQHVVNAAEADVVGPAVAAEGPHALLGQILLVLQDKGALLRGLRLLQGGDQRVGHLPGHGRVLPLGKILPNLRYGHTL
ncbi:Acyltransferase family protein, partial [Dysosmobacter welbionis]